LLDLSLAAAWSLPFFLQEFFSLNNVLLLLSFSLSLLPSAPFCQREVARLSTFPFVRSGSGCHLPEEYFEQYAFKLYCLLHLPSMQRQEETKLLPNRHFTQLETKGNSAHPLPPSYFLSLSLRTLRDED
jgi:hypothetical protein